MQLATTQRSAGPHRPLAAGGLYCQKRLSRAFFDSLHPVHRHRVFYIYAFPVSSLFALRFLSARAVVSGRFSLLVSK